MSASARSISRTETAKLIRKSLKKAFPGVKFSVRSTSYSGGGSIDTTWVDGPTETQVKEIIFAYDGKGFDGMIDLSYYYDSWLMPDGSVSIAKCRHLDIDNPPPAPEAELVHFSCGYNGYKRLHSPELVKRVAAEVSEQIGWDAPEIIETTSYWSKSKQVPTAYYKDGRGQPDYDEHVYREFVNTLHNTSADEPAKSETIRQQEEYEAWKAEQDALEETAEPVDDSELNQAITEDAKADIAKNCAANDAAESRTDKLTLGFDFSAQSQAYQNGYNDAYDRQKCQTPSPGQGRYEYAQGYDDGLASWQSSFPHSSELFETEPESDPLCKELYNEAARVALGIVSASGSPFIKLCVQRKLETISETSPLADIIQVGDDIVRMSQA